MTIMIINDYYDDFIYVFGKIINDEDNDAINYHHSKTVMTVESDTSFGQV